MKKSLKKQLKKWNIGDYVRQFSIVTGGVLLTLWLTRCLPVKKAATS